MPYLIRATLARRMNAALQILAWVDRTRPAREFSAALSITSIEYRYKSVKRKCISPMDVNLIPSKCLIPLLIYPKINLAQVDGHGGD
jgi:hypothetical protein